MTVRIVRLGEPRSKGEGVRYCEDEARCHRSVLRALLEERDARVA